MSDDVAASNKEIGLRLLELSAGVEGFEFVDGRRGPAAVTGLLQRVRRFTRYAYALVDQDGGLEAGVLLRAMTEYAFTLRWMGIDPELTCLLWMRDDQLSTLDQDEQYARETGAGLLHPVVKATREADRDELDRVINSLPGIEQRLVAVGGRTKPNLREIARLTDASEIYLANYRFDSRVSAHPTQLAAEQVLDVLPDEAGLRVSAEPLRELPEPYGVGAALLAMALQVVAEQVPELELDTDVIAAVTDGLRVRLAPDDQAD